MERLPNSPSRVNHGRRRILMWLGGSAVLGLSSGFTWNQLLGQGAGQAKAAPPPAPAPTDGAPVPTPASRDTLAPDPRPQASPTPVRVADSPALRLRVVKGEANQQSVIAVPPDRSRPFSARSLPPERVVIPTIELDSRIIPLGTRLDKGGNLVWETAAFAVGHHLGTSNPGDGGNTVLSGHISSRTEGAVFKRLPQVKAGDGVIVFTSQQPYLYRVVDTDVVEPSAVEVLDATPTPTLTLITCVPDGVYSHRLVVRAEAVKR